MLSLLAAALARPADPRRMPERDDDSARPWDVRRAFRSGGTSDTWVSGYSVRVLTSYPSIYIMRRLMSRLDHQETTLMRPCPSYLVRESIPARGCETAKISPVH